MHEVKVTFDNGDYLYTEINGTAKEIINYYQGKIFNLGNGENDLMAICTTVEFIH